MGPAKILITARRRGGQMSTKGEEDEVDMYRITNIILGDKVKVWEAGDC